MNLASVTGLSSPFWDARGKDLDGRVAPAGYRHGRAKVER
jgi:hypothetical protein